VFASSFIHRADMSCIYVLVLVAGIVVLLGD
jgi:hypothetical protein